MTTVNPVVNFTVTQNSDGSFTLTCDQPQVDVPKNQGNTTLTFNLNGYPGWRFPAVAEAQAGEDYYFGITIFGDQGCEFHGVHRSNDGQQVTIQDRNNNARTYTYSATVENPTLQMTLTIDPSIINQTD